VAAASKCLFIGEFTGTLGLSEPSIPEFSISECVIANRSTPINGITRNIPGVDASTGTFVEAQVESPAGHCIGARFGANSNPKLLFEGLEFTNADKKIYVVECECPNAGSHGDDVVLLSSPAVDIRMRTTIKDFYSVIEATAIRVGDCILEMTMGDTHTFWINGVIFNDNVHSLQRRYHS